MAYTKPLSKQAYTYIAILFAVIFLISLIAGCGNDDIVTNNNGNGNGNGILIYSKDSFTVRGTGIHNFADEDTVLYDSTNTDSMKVTFEVSTNCDSVDSPTFRLTVGSYGGNNFNVLYDNAANINQSFTGYFRKNKTLIVTNVLLHINSVTLKYLKISNIKVYKL